MDLHNSWITQHKAYLLVITSVTDVLRANSRFEATGRTPF